MIDTTPPKPLVPVPHVQPRQQTGEVVVPDTGRPLLRRLAWGTPAVLSWLVGAYALYLVDPGSRRSLAGRPTTGSPSRSKARATPQPCRCCCGRCRRCGRCGAGTPWSHRWVGRVYVLGVLVAGTSGAVAAIGTTAGPVAGAGFLLLGLLWIGCTLEALLRIRGGDVRATAGGWCGRWR